MSGTDLNCKREHGISLETLQRERTSVSMTGEPRGFSRVMTETQGASRGAPGKSNLHLSCEGELGIALESLQGK